MPMPCSDEMLGLGDWLSQASSERRRIKEGTAALVTVSLSYRLHGGYSRLGYRAP